MLSARANHTLLPQRAWLAIPAADVMAVATSRKLAGWCTTASCSRS